MRRFLLFLLLLTGPVGTARPVLDVYVSTGDNHFLGSTFPTDSPASIEATFDLLKEVNHARRIDWRGLAWLYANMKPNERAVRAAHARGMEIWGMGSPWHWRSQHGTPGFGDSPLTFESKLCLEHPEWVPVDRHGMRRQGGPALQVMDLAQRMNTFSQVSPIENEARQKLAAPRDIHVGRDQDAPTIAHAIKLAQPGDTIHLEPKVYRDYAGFHGKKGVPGRPITLDGHGATLEGSEPLDPTQWREVSPSLFAAEPLTPYFDEAMLARWFFLMDGRMNFMNRASKGRSAPLKAPEDLQPGEWTFVKGPPRAGARPLEIGGTFYLRLAPGVKLGDARISVPVRSAGVQFSGDNAHLIIRNLTCTHAYNDGFNIHGDCRDVIFENIRAIECGDDGISAHESAQYRVQGFVSIGNSTGICDTGTAQTSYDRVFIARCHSYDLFFLDDGRYRMTNAAVLSSSQNPFVVTGREDKHCELVMDNVLFRRATAGPPVNITRTAALKAARFTLEGLELEVKGTAELRDCLINGKPAPGGSAQGADRERLLRDVVPQEFRAGFQ